MDKIGILRCGVIQMLSIKVPFCGCRGFCHRTESDIFLFSLSPYICVCVSQRQRRWVKRGVIYAWKAVIGSCTRGYQCSFHVKSKTLPATNIYALKFTWKVIYHGKWQPYFSCEPFFFKNRVLARSMSWLISFEWAYSGCKERKPRITKWKIHAHSRTPTHDPSITSLVPNPLDHQIWHTNVIWFRYGTYEKLKTLMWY